MLLKNSKSLRFCASGRDFSWLSRRSVRAVFVVAESPDLVVADDSLSDFAIVPAARVVASVRTIRKTHRLDLLTGNLHAGPVPSRPTSVLPILSCRGVPNEARIAVGRCPDV